ncbi:MAG: hypothetical protein ACKOYC_06755 [Bacteroidota bacterium]
MKIGIFAMLLISISIATAQRIFAQPTACIPQFQGRKFVSMDELLALESISVCNDAEKVDAIIRFNIIVIQKDRDPALSLSSFSQLITQDMREILANTDPWNDIKVIFEYIRVRLKDGNEITLPSFEIETR